MLLLLLAAFEMVYIPLNLIMNSFEDDTLNKYYN